MYWPEVKTKSVILHWAIEVRVWAAVSSLLNGEDENVCVDRLHDDEGANHKNGPEAFLGEPLSVDKEHLQGGSQLDVKGSSE